MPLLGNQIKTKQEIINYFDCYPQSSFWLSGEPGVGKTYITAAFIHDYLELHPMHHVLIISPTNVKQKWQEIVKIFNREQQPHIIVQKEAKTENIRLNHQINIITNTHLTWLNYIDSKKCQLVVYDEFHEVAPGKRSFNHIRKFLNREKTHNNSSFYHPNLLALTGTAANQSSRKLAGLIKMTNPEAYQHATKYNQSLAFLPPINKFINQLWQYISTTINLANVQANLQKVTIEQTIMPINLIDLTPEEQTFYEFVSARVNQIQPSKKMLAADLLDFPRQDQFVTKYSRRVKHNNDGEPWQNLTEDDINLRHDYTLIATSGSHTQSELSRKNTYISALSLNEITLTNTHKFEQLKTIIQENPQQTMLVLLNSNQHLKRLESAIHQMTNRNVKILSTHTQPTKRADTINNYLNEDPNNIMIANANNIKTGIDLNSVNIIIWYQLLPNLSDILQTQRRAQRLNSQGNSKVYYLAYANTNQEALIKELSQSNTKNAATYGSRSTDALSQLQGILFKQFS